MRHATMLVAILTITPLTSATAQVPVRPGARVRVTHLPICPVDLCVGTRRSVGTLMSVSGDCLLLSRRRWGWPSVPAAHLGEDPSSSRSQVCQGSGSRYRSPGRGRGRVGRRFDDIRGVRVAVHVLTAVFRLRSELRSWQPCLFGCSPKLRSAQRRRQ